VMIRTNYLVVCVISIAASPLLLLLPPPVRHALTTPEKRFILPLYYYIFVVDVFYFFLLSSLYYCNLFSFSCAGTIIYNNNSCTLRAFEWRYNIIICATFGEIPQKTVTSTGITVALLLLYYYV